MSWGVSWASIVPVPAEPWTRGLFLTRIEKFPVGGFPLDETPLEWMAAAWEIDRVRNELSGEMARSVSKIGHLAYADEFLNYLSRSLPISRQVELFFFIRDSRNEFRETEFRPGFERAFPDCVSQLPLPLTSKQLSEKLGVAEDEFKRHYLHPKPFAPDPNHASPEESEEIPF
jgi:hypothetical protein